MNYEKLFDDFCQILHGDEPSEWLKKWRVDLLFVPLSGEELEEVTKVTFEWFKSLSGMVWNDVEAFWRAIYGERGKRTWWERVHYEAAEGSLGEWREAYDGMSGPEKTADWERYRQRRKEEENAC